MDLTTQRRCLVTIAAGFLIGTAGAILWSLSEIDSLGGIDDRAQGQQVQPAIPSQRSSKPFDQRFAAQTLRAPLYDPPSQRTPRVEPPQPPTIAPARVPVLELTLVGTIIDDDHRYAIVADASGQFDVKGIGQSLELSPQGITLQTIESEQVTVQYLGRESTVQLDRSHQKPADATSGKRANKARRNP